MRPDADREAFDAILASALRAASTELGMIQTLDRSSDVLTIVAHRGLPHSFVSRFASVGANPASACGRSLQTRAQVVIPDVEADHAFAPNLPAANEAGFRAVQSTPVYGRYGKPLGVLSTHFRQPGHPGDAVLGAMESHAREVAALIERRQTAVGSMDVLVIGRDAATTGLTRELLQDLGHVARVVPDERAALDLWQRWEPDGAIVEIGHDPSVAAALADRLRAIPRGRGRLRIVAVSFSGRPSGPRHPFDHVLDAPFDLDDLRYAIEGEMGETITRS